MILITGASGKTGRAVTQALVARHHDVRALVHRAESTEAMIRLGARETLVGSMADPDVLRRAAEGTRAIYHICPNVSPDEILFGRNAIAAARAAGTRRFVFHSVLHPQIEAMSHHWTKMRVEDLLFAAELDVTILQPTAYMQNLLAGWRSIVEEGILRVPYPVTSRISLVDLSDVAEVAARVLTEPGHENATYELVGTAPLNQTDVAEVLSEALGRTVRAEAESVKAWDARAGAGGMATAERDTLISMFRYYERHGLAGNSNVLRWLLVRPPTSLAAFVCGVAGDLGASTSPTNGRNSVR
ncbi:SDR family oxidoreductase [Bradyrhizobium prioriisuperbiae]|uniref:SDR family oxidoreductase n=1 Tax=Bradyrhizobium prioriisuperbiae TaxID=2854389 RepID=UPI0028E3C25E|nr:NmrA family NAD(P)-binding protein [Bradyrhizobium prioritasuperba]